MDWSNCKHNDYVEITCSDVFKNVVFRSKVFMDTRNPLVTIPFSIYENIKKGEQISLGNTYWIKHITKLTQRDFFLDNILKWYET